MRKHSRTIGAVALILASLAESAGRPSHAALTVATTAQIDPLSMMARARNLPTLLWTDYSLVFAK